MDRKKLENLELRIRHAFEVLLKTSHPRVEKRYSLVKIVVGEDTGLSRTEIERGITAFYKLKYERRTAEQFRRIFKARPYPWLLDQFYLTFRTAAVSETKVFKTAAALRHMLKNVIPVPEPIGSTEFLHLVVHKTTRPRIDQIAAGIGLRTFLGRWGEIARMRYGDTYDSFFADLENHLDEQTHSSPKDLTALSNFYRSDTQSELLADPEITQTDLDWFKGLIESLKAGQRPSLYPLKAGPKSATVYRIETLVRAAHTHYPFRHELLEQTILRVCHHYLAEFKQAAA